jgi:hypothetical protein
LTTDLNSKIDLHVSNTNAITSELASKVVQSKDESDQQIVKLSEEIANIRSDLIQGKGECTSWLGECFEQLHQEVETVKSTNKCQFELVNLEICTVKRKFSGGSTVVCGVNTSQLAGTTNVAQTTPTLVPLYLQVMGMEANVCLISVTVHLAIIA